MFGIGRISKKVTLWTVIGAVPMIALVLLRGNVGTDTPIYISIIEVYRDNPIDPPQLFEPLFELVLINISLLPIPSWAVLALVSLSTTVLFIRGWIRIEPTLVIFTGVYAQFFVDMTMNGIRYGLAFALIVFGSRFLLEKKMYFFWTFVLAATFVQVSSALLAVLLYFLHEQRWRTVFYTIALVGLVGMSFSDRLLIKIVAYQLEHIPSGLSGLMPLTAIWLTLGVWITDTNARRQATLKIIGLAAISIAFYLLAQVTYAGLRFLQLTLFLSALTFACHLKGSHIRMRHRTAILLIAIGLFLGVMKLRHYSESIDGAQAQFIPYKFYWEDYQ